MENTAILREWFGRVDTEKTGSATAPQLKRALAVGILDFPLTVVQQMISMYDFDRNGTMSFDGVVDILFPMMCTSLRGKAYILTIKNTVCEEKLIYPSTYMCILLSIPLLALLF